MSSTIKNIIILVIVGGILFVVYFFFIRTSAEQTNLISSADTNTTSGVPSLGSSAPDQFLTLLLSVKNIKLNDAIFSNVAFTSLHDSSITLTPDGTEGRTNPFAQFGASDIVAPPTPSFNINATTNTIPTTPVAPTTPPASGIPVKGINQ